MELKSLTVEDFIRILKEPKNALAKQYTALLETEDLKKRTVRVDAAYVRKQLADIVKDQDLSRYIL